MSLNNEACFVHDGRMNVIMNIQQIKTLEQVSQFLESTADTTIMPPSKDEAYRWVQHNLKHFRYRLLKRPDKGMIRQFLCHITGYSRQQITRLIQQYQQTGRVIRQQRTTQGFKGIYTQADIYLLAEIDTLHDTPSGPMIKKLCERAYERFNDQQYQRLAGISVSHLYNLRASKHYQQQRRHYTKTTPTKNNAIGERRKPRPEGKPGYIRIDSVHQGDLDGVKGLYHINAVDEVTQWQVVCTVERISEQFMIPALEALLGTFPFTIIGFHADNGSEYINNNVVKLLNKLHIELTKSRSRQTNDNALAESKNASTIRKILGYCHIPQRFAPQVNEFNQQYLVPYLNFHRPCFFPYVIVDEKGKQRKKYRYEDMMTPYDKLTSLENAEQYLKKGVTLEELDAEAKAISDNEAARQWQAARTQLFNTIFGRCKKAG
jgi:hypothetical protein